MVIIPIKEPFLVCFALGIVSGFPFSLFFLFWEEVAFASEIFPSIFTPLLGISPLFWGVFPCGINTGGVPILSPSVPKHLKVGLRGKLAFLEAGIRRILEDPNVWKLRVAFFGLHAWHRDLGLLPRVFTAGLASKF